MKSAIITGITGQDGSYLANYLIKKKIKVFGILRRTSGDPLERLEYFGIKDKIKLIHSDLSEHQKITTIIKKIKPTYFFNLGAQSFVTFSYDNPIYTDNINNVSVINILESIKNFSNKTRFYQASSSEMYGLNETNEKKLKEKTPFNPISPYSIAKLSAYYYTRMYRNSYNIFASNGILFNHESPLRGQQFVTKKIISNLVRIKFNVQKTPLVLGNIYSRRDWGHAEDYVEMMYKILSYKKPDDFVISSEKQYSIKEFINLVCDKINLKIFWSGKGMQEKAYIKNGKNIIKISKKFFRPSDVIYLLGDSSKARKYLKWKAKKTISYLVSDMINFELNKIKINVRNKKM
jgi:GDPmannose 4,6-dehydratase